MPLSSQRSGRWIYSAAFFLILFAVMTSISTAKVACIRLTSEHTADMTDLMRFRRFHEWKDKTGNDLGT